jgi:hypothetical protein
MDVKDLTVRRVTRLAVALSLPRGTGAPPWLPGTGRTCEDLHKGGQRFLWESTMTAWRSRAEYG